MLAERLIDEARANQIRLIVANDRLKVAFRGCDHTDLLRLIAQHQVEIVRILKARNPLGPGRAMPFGISAKPEKVGR